MSVFPCNARVLCIPEEYIYQNMVNGSFPVPSLFQNMLSDGKVFEGTLQINDRTGFQGIPMESSTERLPVPQDATALAAEGSPTLSPKK